MSGIMTRGTGRLSKLELVAIPAVVFEMGSSAEEVELCTSQWSSRVIDPSYRPAFRDWIRKEFPKHRRRMEAFNLSRFPVTNGEYAEFLAEIGKEPTESIMQSAPSDHPVWGVSYDDATAYAEWRGERLGRACRLPTEAEWECAARGPGSLEYPFGREFDATRCNTIEAGIGTRTPVDAYPNGASGYGVFDLAGNVEEWTSSYYAPYPGGSFIADDLSRELGPTYRVLRGGSFALGGDLARCARRHGPHPGELFRHRGFRLVVT